MDARQAETSVRECYLEHFEIFEEALQKMIGSLQLILEGQQTFRIAAVTGRIKDIESSVDKLHRKYVSKLADCSNMASVLSLLTDIIGLRVVCYYEDHVGPIGELIAAQFAVVGRTDKILETERGDRFGYRALHLDLQLDPASLGPIDFSELNGMTVEVQIRSIVQDAWSTLDHSVKYKKNLPAQLARRVARLAALAELMDAEFIFIRDEVSNARSLPAQSADALTDVVSFAKLMQQNLVAARLPAYRIDALFDDLVKYDRRLSINGVNEVLRNGGVLDSLRKLVDGAGMSIADAALVRAAFVWHDPRYAALSDTETSAMLLKLIPGYGVSRHNS